MLFRSRVKRGKGDKRGKGVSEYRCNGVSEYFLFTPTLYYSPLPLPRYSLTPPLLFPLYPFTLNPWLPILSEINMSLRVSKIIRTNRRTVALHIQQDGSLVVRAPLHFRNEEIKQFVYQERFWISQKRKLITERNKLRVQREFVNGEGFYI